MATPFKLKSGNKPSPTKFFGAVQAALGGRSTGNTETPPQRATRTRGLRGALTSVRSRLSSATSAAASSARGGGGGGRLRGLMSRARLAASRGGSKRGTRGTGVISKFFR